MVRVSIHHVAVVAVAGVLGCTRPSPPERAAPPAFRLEPPDEGAGAPDVVRIHVSGMDAVASGLVLFQGELDAYHAARVRAAALPSTLEERRIPGTTWSIPRSDAAAPNESVFAPSRRLSAAETYTVGVLGYGALGSFAVRRGPGAYAARIWPPSFAPHGGKRWVFCGTGAMPPPGEVVELEPASVSAVVAAGADSFETNADGCFRLDLVNEPDAGRAMDGAVEGGPAIASEPIAVPPPVLDGTSLDPSPVILDAPAGNVVAGECASDAVTLGPGCVRVLDDRVFVRTGAEPLLWALSTPATVVVAAARPGDELMVGGLTPGTTAALRGTTTDLAGRETAFSAMLALLPARPHLVLNEVLANPNGSDKTSEWVELVNDGSTDIDTAGWSLEDATRGAPLPRGTISPGGYALVVPDGYDPASGTDVAPAEGTLMLRVHQLGGSGLSNQGEALRLRDSSGVVVSDFPALAATKPGVSMARRSPSSSDDDETAFGPSAAPGASPGAANVLADE